MSRIFDALQRAESERSGNDVTALPQGAELLQEAERLATSKWNGDGAVAGNGGAPFTTGIQVLDRIKSNSDSQLLPGSVSLSEAERAEFFAGIPSMPITLSPQSRIVCLTDRESPTAEALRLLGVRLKDMRRNRGLKKLLVTSTIPQEGKSTIAANLACTLAHASQETVLLVEGDLRRPSLCRMFGMQGVSGISEYLRGTEDAPSDIYHLEDAGLWVLPAGNAPSNPLELLQSPRLGHLLDNLARYFDWIIIDSPPVLPLADTSVWMRLADGILLVARQGITEKQQLKKGLEALESRKLLGALLNGGVASAYSGYYYRATT
jgi:capsular exopolysaccharide synthesis family protein